MKMSGIRATILVGAVATIASCASVDTASSFAAPVAGGARAPLDAPVGAKTRVTITSATAAQTGGSFECYVLKTEPGTKWEVRTTAADTVLSIGKGDNCGTMQQLGYSDDVNTLLMDWGSRIRFTSGGGAYLIKPSLLGGGTGGLDMQITQLAATEDAEQFAAGTPLYKAPQGSASTYAGATPARTAGDVFSDCQHCPEMVVVPAGSFMMGSDPSQDASAQEGPRHQVTFRQPFAIGRYEVTFDEYDACVSDNGCTAATDYDWGRGRRPVVSINYKMAEDYVAWLSNKSGHAYFIPTEAEWEYAARAGTTTDWNTGEAIITQDANYLNQFAKTVPVGSYASNAFGLFDVHGNVTEWTQDCLDTGYLGAPTDGSANTSGDCLNRHTARGGSYASEPKDIRSAARFVVPTTTRDAGLGFRVTRVAD